ncbi:MAG: N-acetylmuramoyl-L-alanine amidase [Acidobacteriota bacterium]
MQKATSVTIALLVPVLVGTGIFLAGEAEQMRGEIVLVNPQKRQTIKTIVIDPGHGGDETGAEGKSGIFEKDIVLDIAVRLKRQLQKVQGLKVILTRDRDLTMSLDERTAIANHNRADLFISIHVNASRGKKVNGAETYFLSYEAADEEIRALAALENNVVGLPEEKSEEQKGLEMILWDMAQAQYLKESSELAEWIQEELNKMLGIRNRGIKQAPFRVLMGATMPAVLIEAGFLSNPEEEEKLKEGSYREDIASAIYRSILSYKEMVEKRTGKIGFQESPRFTNQ